MSPASRLERKEYRQSCVLIPSAAVRPFPALLLPAQSFLILHGSSWLLLPPYRRLGLFSACFFNLWRLLSALFLSSSVLVAMPHEEVFKNLMSSPGTQVINRGRAGLTIQPSCLRDACLHVWAWISCFQLTVFPSHLSFPILLTSLSCESASNSLRHSWYVTHEFLVP